MYSEARQNLQQVADKPKSNAFRNIRALVADDHGPTLKLVGLMLEALGFRVDTADSGSAAIRAFNQSCYGLVVTDYHMPEVDGYTLANWVKQRTRQTCVVMMTGCAYAEVADYMNTGMVDAWIFKPFKMGQLAELLGELKLWGAKPSES